MTGELGVNFMAKTKIFLLAESGLALGPTMLLISDYQMPFPLE
jgi:hypothetical protein